MLTQLSVTPLQRPSLLKEDDPEYKAVQEAWYNCRRYLCRITCLRYIRLLGYGRHAVVLLYGICDPSSDPFGAWSLGQQVAVKWPRSSRPGEGDDFRAIMKNEIEHLRVSQQRSHSGSYSFLMNHD
jgi:hypothetical protein